MIKVDLDDSWLKYHYRRTDGGTDGQTTLSLESLSRFKTEYGKTFKYSKVLLDWMAPTHI